MKKTALLVVDIQQAYHDFPLLKSSVDLSLFAVNAALRLFRRTGSPICFVQHTDSDFVKEGSPGFALSHAIECKEGELRITKRHPNSFHQTLLAETLKEAGVGFVVVCGLAASKCVMATIQGAKENGFSAAFLQHGVADIKESLVLMSYETCPAVSIEVLEHFFTSTPT